jgi:general secretion pathway protein H
MRSRGFTLVEILVVVVIIAFVTSIAILAVGTTGRDTQLDEETRRIEGLVGLLHERALLEGRDFGLRIEPAAYEFVVYDPNRDRWLTFDQETEFRHRELPKGVSFQLQLDSQIEGTPFRLTLMRDGTTAKASVDGDALGKLSHISSDHQDKPT